MLNDFSWNMTGYIPKHAVNPSDDGIPPYVAERIFQLEPEPPTVDNPNEYILSALREKDLKYFSFFLHHYELQLNKRIKTFLGVDGGNRYDTDRFLDIKLSCREQMLQKLMDYAPAKGAEYATYIFPFIRDAMLRFRMGEEKWSVSSLTNYKMVRSMAWLYHNTKDAVSEFAKKYNCDLALAEGYLKVVRGIRNQQPFYVTDEDGEETGEDVALDDTWNYTDILWNGFLKARDFVIIKEAAVTGIPMLIFMAANFVKALGLNTIIMNLIGEDGMAVFTVCDNVLLIVEMLTGGIIGVIPNVAGILFGEKDYVGIRVLCKKMLKYSYMVLAVVFICVMVFTEQITILFGSSGGELGRQMVDSLRIFALCVVPYLWNKFMVSYYESIEETAIASFCYISSKCNRGSACNTGRNSYLETDRRNRYRRNRCWFCRY